MSKTDSTREHLIETYRKKAKHYDLTSRFYPAPGYPQRAHRLRAVQALGLRPGDSVVDIACGTGLNFPLIERLIGPGGRIVGVDLTDAMLAQAQRRIETNGWSNVSLVQADAAEFDFPTEVDAILSTYALTQVPECGDVIAHGAAALSARWALGRAGSEGSRQRSSVAGAARNRGCAAIRLHRRVDRAPSVGGDSRSDAGDAGRCLLDRVGLRDGIPRRRGPRLSDCRETAAGERP